MILSEQMQRTSELNRLNTVMNPKPVKVIAVTGGKGGVGKTNLSVNIGVCLAQQGKKTLMFDADLGLANIDVILGLKIKHSLADVLSGDCELIDAIASGPAGLQIIPASSGMKHMAELGKMEHAGIIRAFSQLNGQFDYLIIDTAAGITDNVISFSQASQDILIVVCDEPTSITDAYALMKILHNEHNIDRFHIISNMVRSAKEGRDVFSKLTNVTGRFLDVTLEYLGAIPYDDNVRKAIKKQKSLLELFPRSEASTAIKSVVKKIEAWPYPTEARGNIEFFMERLLQRGIT